MVFAVNKFNNNSNKPETGELRFGISAPDNTWIKADGSQYVKNNLLTKKLITGQYFQWVIRTSQFGTSIIRSVVYGGNLWVAGGNGGTLRTSTDAVTWVTQTSQFGTSTIQSVAYGNELWVAGGTGGALRTSTDAVTWITQTSQFGTSNINSVAYGNSLWIAGGTGGALRTSVLSLPNIFLGNNVWGWIKT